MIIHTLGPEATDSYAAAQIYNHQHYADQAQIVGHPSFESLLSNLTAYSQDYLLIPAAFKSTIFKASWGDIHYALLEKIVLMDCFITKLDPLVVIKRLNTDNRIGYTHAATAQLFTRIVKNVEVQTVASKYLAYQDYQLNQAGYVLTNIKNVQITPHEQIIKRLTPSMVWCVYQIS
jgi:hypothetical protein